MATLTELLIYPIKSCAGIAVPEAQFHVSGLVAQGVHDREWMLVTHDGQFLTQREYPRMALVTPRIDGDTVEVNAPGMPPLRLPLAHDREASGMTVRIWDHSVQAADCGDAAAAWFVDAISGPCRLVRFRPEVHRPTSTKWTGGVPAETRFADGYPILVIGQASLDDLNAKLVRAGRAPLPMNRFRPNLVVGGIDAFEEDYVASFAAAGLALRPVKPCARCPIPAIDQATGIPGPDPLDILHTYRANPRMEGAVCMGMNCIVTAGAGGALRVGQQLDAAIAF
ncbi:MOSC N-terminal beta barrel domain-containing protein [Massilia sp. UMI-21]|nr:MOSC N-terminal beta barrel domain-containing protein [Massilia sp. UMI-21]